MYDAMIKRLITSMQRPRAAARTESSRYSGLGVNGCPLEGTWQQMSPPRLRAGSVKLAAGPRALRFQTGPTRAPRSPEGGGTPGRQRERESGRASPTTADESANLSPWAPWAPWVQLD